MLLTKNPIAFLDQLVTGHKAWLKWRPVRGESVRYMREAVDQRGSGQEFLTHYVCNDNPQHPDLEDENCDLALLQKYEAWRALHDLRPIEAWDGSRLRPWLPPESNPAVPAVLAGDLSHFNDAYVRWPPRMEWEPLDAFGNACESYFAAIRRHHVWSRPIGGGKLRLYRHNELNNIEVAPYSIRFWGFLKWVDERRRTLLGETVVPFKHDGNSDITFMDSFNRSHFPWHDDVFGNGKCPSWDNQFGLLARHKYPMNTYGFGLEFLEFHSDLLVEFNTWLADVGLPGTKDWRSGSDPWDPGIHHSAHILKQAGFGPWSLGGTNGQALDPYEFAPDLFDKTLQKFQSGSELGAYMEGHGFAFHGAGHVEHCDIRDPYTNNYSLRFFHWHQWIDTLYQEILASGRPKHFWEDPKRTLATPVGPEVFAKFTPQPTPRWPLTGTWTYRSYNADAELDDSNPGALWFAAQMTLRQSVEAGAIVMEGLLEGGSPAYVYDVSGHLDQRNVHYELTPDWREERAIIVLTARGATPQTKNHEYRYRGHLVPMWLGGKEQVPVFIGSVLRANRPDDRSLEGKVGSFIAVKQPETGEQAMPSATRTQGLRAEDSINKLCPFSNKPIHPDALIEFGGKVIGFCSTAHRDQFAAVVEMMSRA